MRARGWYVVYPSYCCTRTMSAAPGPLPPLSQPVVSLQDIVSISQESELICHALLNAEYHVLEHRTSGHCLAAGGFSPLTVPENNSMSIIHFLLPVFQVRDLIDKIREAFIETLDELQWMDEASKEKAREKVRASTFCPE